MSLPSRRKGFTLVELLVVIGIIALLISILLPTLSNARRAAQTVACSSNARQVALAIRLFAQEHKGYMPALSDKNWAWQRDPQRKIWVYRSGTNPPVMLDWYSSLLPYMGVRGVEWFPNAGEKSKVFLCPSDSAQTIGGNYGAPSVNGEPNGPGLLIYNNMVPYDAGWQVSYGVNADIGSLVGDDNKGHFGPGDTMNVYGAPKPNGLGLPLNAKIDKVRRSAEVLLVGDCGTRPWSSTGSKTTGLDRNDAVYFTTNYMEGNAAVQKDEFGTLAGMLRCGWLGTRVPWTRHKNKINVVFCDGHGETIAKGDEKKVRISPYNF